MIMIVTHRKNDSNQLRVGSLESIDFTANTII